MSDDGRQDYDLDQAENALVCEAALTAAGNRFLTVVHGTIEDPEHQALVTSLFETAWKSGRVELVRSDRTELRIMVGPPTATDQRHADRVVDELELFGRALDPGTWKFERRALRRAPQAR